MKHKERIKMKAYDRITDLIGGTPLLRLNRYMAEKKLEAAIYGKLEYQMCIRDRFCAGCAPGGEAELTAASRSSTAFTDRNSETRLFLHF